MPETFVPALAAAQVRIAAVRPAAYDRTRKVHWRTGADWLYGHLLDGDLASNYLSWQWVSGTGSSKPYVSDADNVTRYAPALFSLVDRRCDSFSQWWIRTSRGLHSAADLLAAPEF